MSRAVRVTACVLYWAAKDYIRGGRMWGDKSKAEQGAKQGEGDVRSSENAQKLNFVGEVFRNFSLCVVGGLSLVTQIEVACT